MAAMAAATTADSLGSYKPVEATVAVEPAEAAAPVRAWPWRAAAVSAAAAAVFTAGAVVGNSVMSRHAGAQRLRADPAAAIEAAEVTWKQGDDFDSFAPKMDVDVQYIGAKGWGTNYDHIPTPEMCAAMCWGVEKCAAYTWVKDAGLPGCPSQCWLMSGVSEKKPLKGLVSGTPPKRKEYSPPTTVSNEASGSMYCFALMQPTGYEKGLLEWQRENKASLFGCDKAAVYSNEKINLGAGVVTEVVNSTLKCGFGGDSMSALNSWIFIEVWRKVLEVGDYKDYDWTVKIDPDAVFFPKRLSAVLTKHQGAAYVNNCKYGMHGPIEVFGIKAMKALAEDYGRSWDGKAPKTCVTKLEFGTWGEDMFIDQCLQKVLEVGPRPLDSKVMCEAHCDCPTWYWCNAGADVVSYHPFKSIDAYKTCSAAAMAQEEEAKLMKLL